MPVAVRPNLLTALRSRLLTEARIASQIHDRWRLPTRAIRLRRAGGPLVENDYSLGLWRSRVDLFCYGSAGHEAIELIDTVLPALCPLQGTPADFTIGPCRVALIEPEAEVYADVETDTRYPFAWVPLSVLWRGLAVAA
jgi:hypothetical protein